MDAPACEHHPWPEFRPVTESTWEGVLSENCATGAPELTWTVYFDGYPDGRSGVQFHIEWIPFDVSSWRELEGAQAECEEFGEPIEAYLFDGEHSSFDYVRIEALHQAGTTVRFAIHLGWCEVDRVKVNDEDDWADIDRLRVVVDAEFKGIDIQTSNGRLADFIDTTGLALEAGGSAYRPTGA
ncbi:hypothetical protein ACWCPQ_10785 [Nocardia sp. NPDC001965]